MRQTAVRIPSGTTVRAAAIGLIVIAAAFVALLGSCSASSSAPSLGKPPRDDGGRAPIMVDAVTQDAVTKDDGVLPSRVTVFDDQYPGVANLDPDLLHALRQAANAATDAGIELYINSGWRSPNYQSKLFRDAVARYGSEEEAARWVAPAHTSAHVSGDAVDIGSANALAWLRSRGPAFGLCQIYRNEPWHYELRSEAIDKGCPRMFADSSRDPRLEQ